MLRVALVIILTAAAWWSLQIAWVDHLSRSPQLPARQRAARLAPWSAAVHERLAEKLDETGADPIPALEQAAAADPASARRFERLGQRAEFAGSLGLAERSLLQAATLSRLYQPRYLLAQFYFRRHDPTAFDRWSRQAFDVAPGGVTPLIELASRMTPDPVALARQSLTMKPAVARQFLFFLVGNHHAAEATGLARHLAETGGPMEVPPLLGFCEQSLADAAVDPALEVWNILCHRRLLPYSGLDRTSPVTNADFSYTPVGSAFDWHMEENMTWQYVPLHRGATYRVRFEGGETPAWRIFYPTRSGWREMPASQSFVSPAEVVRLALPGPHGGIRLEVVP